MTLGRGLLIAVEGCDRGGKTTQCKLLQEYLNAKFGICSEYVKFPGNTFSFGLFPQLYEIQTEQHRLERSSTSTLRGARC